MPNFTLQVLTALCCLAVLASCAEKKEGSEAKVEAKAEEKVEAKAEVKPAQKEEAKPGEEREGRGMVTDESIMAALKDKRYLMRQLKCALGEGTCDPVGRKIKTYAPLILRGSCPKCTPQETRQIQQVLSHIQRHYPKEWNRILKQFTGQQ